MKTNMNSMNAVGRIIPGSERSHNIQSNWNIFNESAAVCSRALVGCSLVERACPARQCGLVETRQCNWRSVLSTDDGLWRDTYGHVGHGLELLVRPAVTIKTDNEFFYTVHTASLETWHQVVALATNRVLYAVEQPSPFLLTYDFEKRFLLRFQSFPVVLSHSCSSHGEWFLIELITFRYKVWKKNTFTIQISEHFNGHEIL